MVQKQSNSSCANGNTCSVAVTATGSGHVGIVTGSAWNGNGTFISSISAGGTWAVPSGCQQTGGGATTDLSCAYILSLSAGVTTITVNWTGASPGSNSAITFWEYSWGGTTTALDNMGTVVTGSANPQTGLTPTLSGTNDVIIQCISLPTGTINSVSVYGNLQILTLYGDADLENTNSTTPPSWTLDAAHVSHESYLAIKGS